VCAIDSMLLSNYLSGLLLRFNNSHSFIAKIIFFEASMLSGHTKCNS
jgi:hypothetical protein